MYSPVSVAMAGCSEGGTVSGRARALNVSTPAHSKRAPTVAATLMTTDYRTRKSSLRTLFFFFFFLSAFHVTRSPFVSSRVLALFF